VEYETLCGEDQEQGLEIEAGERIDEEIALAEGDLNEAELLVIAMKAVSLRIDSDGIEAGEVRAE
jgi:hypothetical protein